MELKHTAKRDGRLSSFLKEEMKMSTGLVNRLKWQQKIFVNGEPQHNDFAVKTGDVITAVLDDEQPNYPPQEGELTILYEDDHIIAVDKPAGMLIHPSHSRNDGTLANYLLGYYGKTGPMPMPRCRKDPCRKPTTRWCGAALRKMREPSTHPLPESLCPACCGRFGKTARRASRNFGYSSVLMAIQSWR